MEDRTGQIGASDIAALLGYNPWSSPLNQTAIILGHITVKETIRMKFGRDIQPLIANMVSERLGLDAVEDEVTIYHHKYPWMQATPDFAIGPDRIPLELKFVGDYTSDHWGLDGDPEGVPEYVIMQCIQQANLLGKNEVIVAALIGGHDLRIFNLKITAEDIETLELAAVNFYEKWILPGEIPDADYRDVDTMKALYPNSEARSLVAGEVIASAVEEFNRYKAEIKALGIEQDAIKAQIQSEMGVRDTLTNSLGKVLATWKQTKDKVKVDWPFIARQVGQSLPGFDALVKKHTTITPGHRTFLPKT